MPFRIDYGFRVLGMSGSARRAETCRERVPSASVYNSLGFEWVNPVLSLFEDWVLGWVLQTGLLFFSLFQTGVRMGVEGRLLPAPRSLSNGNMVFEHKSWPCVRMRADALEDYMWGPRDRVLAQTLLHPLRLPRRRRWLGCTRV